MEKFYIFIAFLLGKFLISCHNLIVYIYLKIIYDIFLVVAESNVTKSDKQTNKKTYFVSVSGVISTSQVQISGPVLELTVRPGDNVTLYCDCKTSSGVYIKWYKNCSHVNQPSLVLNSRYPHEELMDKDYDTDFLNPFPRFHLVKNESSESYDLLIVNITDSDEGLYYCGTEQHKVEDNIKVTYKYVNSYSNVTTRILLCK